MNLCREKLEMIQAKQLLSARELLDKAGLTKQNLSQLCKQKRNRPEVVGKIAQALGVEVEEIIKDENLYKPI